jgi:ferrochelatase
MDLSPASNQDETNNKSNSNVSNSSKEKKVGVLLLNLGGPETLDDVEEFLYNLFADPDIIRLPEYLSWAQPAIASLIAYSRSPQSKEGYRSIGGGSPIRKTTEDQASFLQGSLQNKDLDAKVYVAMRYWNPYTEEAIEAIKKDGITDLVVLPLYPQFSVSTSGSSLRLLEKIFKEDKDLQDLRHTVIPSWYQRKGYVNAMADLIQKEIDGNEDWRKQNKQLTNKDAHLFFSAHGVPKFYVDQAGDPYKEEMEETIELIVSELERRGVEYNGHTLAYQSRVGPVEWLEPYTDDSIRYLASQGIDALVVVPVSFVSEHIETLEEIDMEYREVAEEAGIAGWKRVPALGCDAVFIDDLANACIEALPYVARNKNPNVQQQESQTPDVGGGLVPIGSVNALLDTYDGERKLLPLPEITVKWEWGWTRSAELWNGRIAMMALSSVLLFEILTGKAAFLYSYLK